MRNLLKRLFAIALVTSAIGIAVPPVEAAGILTAKGSADAPIVIRNHHVDVTINNGFARTQVTQTFFNPNAKPLEAVYSFPVPRSASLSELTVWNGEQKIDGEVVEKEEAQRIHKEERDKGNNTALAEKNEFYTFDFGVSPVQPGSEVRVQFIYYQPLEVDTGVGRYVYPLRDGGTDQAADEFWTSNAKVEQSFSGNITLKSAVPIVDVRLPGMKDVQSSKLDDKAWQIKFDRAGGSLDQDLVLYYKLADNLPGRVEVMAYRPDRNKPGTFMMVVTPGVDLQPLSHGADYTFILDVSGSMQQKLPVLAEGVSKSLGQMRPEDQFRIITFDSIARELVGECRATPENVRSAIERVRSLRTGSSTNLDAGMQLGLKGLDADRATSIILVTDGVTNTGEVNPKAFHDLMHKYDVRVFGFLMGNSSNWPLMRTICDASGGFYAGVSNDDDIVGQIALAKSKILHECMHNASVKITGAKTEKVTDVFLNKIYRGQQFVVFGQYTTPGKATFTLDAKLTGADKEYRTTFDLPEIETANPEIERLWAMNQVELIESKRNMGAMQAQEAKGAIRNIGLAYQIVTDETSMLVLSDEAFVQHGVERNNAKRVATERSAQAIRAKQPAVSYRVDEEQPTFSGNAPSVGGGSGGGAIDPVSGSLVLVLAGAAWIARARKEQQ